MQQLHCIRGKRYRCSTPYHHYFIVIVVNIIVPIHLLYRFIKKKKSKKTYTNTMYCYIMCINIISYDTVACYDNIYNYQLFFKTVYKYSDKYLANGILNLDSPYFYF